MSANDDYAGELGGPDSVPKPRPGLDLGRLNLTAQEGFVLSRVDGTASVRDIVNVCGLGEAPTLAILVRLKEAGLISATGARTRVSMRSQTQQVRDRQRKAAQDQDRASIEEMRAWATFRFDEQALSARSELSDVRKKRILYQFQRIDQLTYYELLEVLPDASDERIRKAYYRQTKRFHPDRYFRRDIGIFREHLAVIFKRLGKAYDVLSDADGRRRYDLLLRHTQGQPGGGPVGAGPAAGQQQAPSSGVPVAPAAAAQTAEGRRERARRIYEVGVSKLKAGIFDGAEADFRQALELEPANVEYREGVGRAQKAGQRAVGVAAFRDGQAAELAGNTKGAAAAYVRAAEHHASQAHLAKAVEALLASGGDLDKALQFAKLAVQMDGEAPDNLVVLAAVQERRGSRVEARATLEQAGRVAPGDPKIMARLAALKAGE